MMHYIHTTSSSSATMPRPYFFSTESITKTDGTLFFLFSLLSSLIAFDSIIPFFLFLPTKKLIVF